MKYKGYIIKPYVVICNGYKYSIYKPDGFTHIASAKTLKEAKGTITDIISMEK